MNNQSEIVLNDFKEISAEVTGFLLPLHNGMILLIIWISFKVQKAVFKVLDRLGSRHINTIIKTNLVISFFYHKFFLNENLAPIPFITFQKNILENSANYLP